MSENNQNLNSYTDSFALYSKEQLDCIVEYMSNNSSKKYFASEEFMQKFAKSADKNFFDNYKKHIFILQRIFASGTGNMLGFKNIQMNVRNGLIFAIYEMLKFEPIENIINFLQEIEEDIFKLADKSLDKSFKFQFYGLYINYYIIQKDYDNAYKYCLSAAKYIYKGAELCFYSALNLIFDKQNKTECFENTQKIIKILKNNKKLNFNNYCAITRFNSYLSKDNNKFLELANYFCKKALKNTSDRQQKGELLFVLSGFYHDLKKYYFSIGYGKITLKYTENKNTILDTLEAIASSYYCLSEFKNALAIYQQLIQFENTDIAKRHMQIADCQYQLGEIELMKYNVKKAYLIGSKDTQVQKNIKETYTEMEKGVYDKINEN